jgi:proline dehydrogenase
VETLLKNMFLFLSKNKTMTKLAKKYGLRFGASRFVAGETIEQAVQKMKELNAQGKLVTIDYLGEFVNDVNEANERTEECVRAIEQIALNKLDAELSLKMTSMGLDISDEVVMANMRKILQAGKDHNVFVTIDMEDSERCENTLRIYKKLRSEYDNIGTVIQSYLYRSEDDVRELNEFKPNLRLVKGAYKEPADVAFPDKKDVDDNLKKLIRIHMENGNYTAVASHDHDMIEFTKKLAEELNTPRDQFEFQLLYNIRLDIQRELVKQGYKMRVYLPYGTDWYGYFMRRLAERPANVAFVLKGMVRR